MLAPWGGANKAHSVISLFVLRSIVFTYSRQQYPDRLFPRARILVRLNVAQPLAGYSIEAKA